MSDINEITVKDWYSWMTGLEVTLNDKTVSIAKGTYSNTRDDATKGPTSFDAMSFELKPDDTYLTSYGLFIALENGVVKYSMHRYVQIAGDISSSYDGSGMLLVDFVQASITVDGDINVFVKHIEKDDSPPPSKIIQPPPTRPYRQNGMQKGGTTNGK